MVALTVRKGLYEYVVVDDGLLSVLGGQVTMALVVRPDDGTMRGHCRSFGPQKIDAEVLACLDSLLVSGYRL